QHCSVTDQDHPPQPEALLEIFEYALNGFGIRQAAIEDVMGNRPPARAIRVAGRRRETARSRARGRRPFSRRNKPFLLRLRTHVGLGAKEVLGAAPKLARTGACQGARCGGVLLSVRANDVRRLQQRWISRRSVRKERSGSEGHSRSEVSLLFKRH